MEFIWSLELFIGREHHSHATLYGFRLIPLYLVGVFSLVIFWVNYI